MSKKCIYLTLVISTLVSFITAPQVNAATNIPQLVTDAQNAGTILKWSISKEGSADFQTRPYEQYNTTKETIAAAEKAAIKLSKSEQLSAQAKLVEPKIQVKRAQAYIDAITSSEKISKLTTNLQNAINSAELSSVEAAYHIATAEYRKQVKLLDRVYGQSTRDGIRNQVKPSMEKLIAEVKFDITVKIYLDQAKSFIEENRLLEASLELDKAKSYIDNQNSNLTFRTILTKEYDETLNSLPLQPLFITSDGKNSVTVNFSRAYNIPLEGLVAGQFKISGETVQSAKLSNDKTSVILTTSDLNANTSYTVSWKGNQLNFKTEAVPDTTGIALTDKETTYLETTDSQVYTAKLTNLDGSNYNGRVQISLGESSAVITSVNGQRIESGQETISYADPNGNLVIIIAAAYGFNAETPSVTHVQPTIQKIDGNKRAKKAGITHFYQLQNAKGPYMLTIDSDEIATEEDFIYTGGYKYKWDRNDLFFIYSEQVSQEVFEKALSKGDKVEVSYETRADNHSTWNLHVDVTEDADLVFQNPVTSLLTFDGYSYDISGTAQPGNKVKVYRNDVLVGNTIVDAKGNWTLGSVSLIQEVTNTFVAYQYAPGKDGIDGEGAVNANNPATTTINEGAFASTQIVLNDKGSNGLSISDTLEFTFHNPSYGHEFKKGLSGTITLNDGFGKIAVVKGEYIDFNTLKIMNFISVDAGFNHKASLFVITETSGIVNQDQLTFSITGNGSSSLVENNSVK
ncbi:hypothetical protein SAMN05421670_2359 [Psychrobacillus psychrotolerans]|uniref:SbsC C-terminal domain-containing protein n=1 Tax=Psychrobacillus psychrotolerans TaxID=126156 RepID=A0A1I5Z3L1_9BACI|nr:hypothetical protein [Psychrobacillus psychrotolerans]SFQ51058.1 hypothetical protein SAMN05421670_2359 [Psychrobacillus psychrotolerans]